MEILNTMETTKLLAINFENKEVANVLDQQFSTQLTVSNTNDSLVMATVDANHQIKAQFQFELQDLGSVSKNVSNPWELLKTPKSLEVSIECVFII